MNESTSRPTWGEISSHRERSRRAGEMIFQSVKDLFADKGPQWAAAIAYYALLSTFPLILAAASIAAYFVDSNWVVEEATALLGEFMPEGEEQVEEIVLEALDARGGVGIIAIGALLWTGTRVFGALTTALNIVYGVGETYSFFKRIIVEAAMLLTIGLFMALALTSGILINLLWEVLEVLPADEGFLYRIIRGIFPPILLLAAFFLIYRFVPRNRPSWHAAVVGAASAALLFLIARPLFLLYVDRFADYNLIYGSIAIAIIFLFWAWIVSLITLIGGELTFHTQAMLIEGHSPEEIEQRHQEQAAVGR